MFFQNVTHSPVTCYMIFVGMEYILLAHFNNLSRAICTKSTGTFAAFAAFAAYCAYWDCFSLKARILTGITIAICMAVLAQKPPLPLPKLRPKGVLWAANFAIWILLGTQYLALGISRCPRL